MNCPEIGNKHEDNKQIDKHYNPSIKNNTSSSKLAKDKEILNIKTKIVKVFTSASSIVLLMAVIFTALSFIVKEKLQSAFAITSIIFFVAFFTLCIIKKTKIKNLYK